MATPLTKANKRKHSWLEKMKGFLGKKNAIFKEKTASMPLYSYQNEPVTNLVALPNVGQQHSPRVKF